MSIRTPGWLSETGSGARDRRRAFSTANSKSNGVGVGGGVRKGFTLPRDCEVTIVPAGQRTILPKGDRVTLLQALGGTATVKTREGEMARLSRTDSIDFGFIEAPD